jgi:malate synthase
VCVFVALVFQHAMSSVALHLATLSHKRHDFRKTRYRTQNVCFDFLYNFCLKYFSLYEELSEIWSKFGLQVKYRLFLSDFNELSRQFLEKYSNIKFNENPSSGSWSIRKEEWTDMTNPTVPLRNFANAPVKRVRSRRTCQHISDIQKQNTVIHKDTSPLGCDAMS